MDATAPAWAAFCRRALGFVPSATDADKPIWADFLQRARGDMTTPLPTQLPLDGIALADWYRFEGVLSVPRAPHRFVVALPVPPAHTGNATEYLARRRLAERLITLDKPAPTDFEVDVHWPRFRGGYPRIALDTHIHQEQPRERSCIGLDGPRRRATIAKGYRSSLRTTQDIARHWRPRARSDPPVIASIQ